jgi:hypothetical protein
MEIINTSPGMGTHHLSHDSNVDRTLQLPGALILIALQRIDTTLSLNHEVCNDFLWHESFATSGNSDLQARLRGLIKFNWLWRHCNEDGSPSAMIRRPPTFRVSILIKEKASSSGDLSALTTRGRVQGPSSSLPLILL